MKNKKKKGFTLIELLAIIVILAIIAVITVPIILNIIENSRRGAATDSAYGYKDAINKYYVGKLSENSGYNIPNGTYTVNGTTGYLVGTETLEIEVSGQKPNSGAVEIENNNVKQACLKFGDYAVTITDGSVGTAQKASCNGTILGASSGGNTSTTTAAQTLMAKAITESALNEYEDKSTVTVPVIINHPAITENTATGSTIPALTSYTYMGADPDNYIYFNCDTYEESEQNSSTCELWRIISVENGQLKITTDNVIGNGPWDRGEVNHNGTSVNDWETSDLNDFLNGKYLNNGIAYNYSKDSKEISVDNKTFMTSYYDTFTATSSGTTGKQHNLLNSETVSMIATSTWYLGGGITPSKTADQAYTMERGNAKYTGDSYTRSTSVNSKVAIISPSDYGFASSACYRGDGQKNLNSYVNLTCSSSNWMYNNVGWLLSPYSSHSYYAWRVIGSGSVDDFSHVGMASGVSPVVYLISDISLSCSGTSSDPYKIIK